MNSIKHKIIITLIKLVLIIGFFIGAYFLLEALGIIEKIRQGFFLLLNI